MRLTVTCLSFLLLFSFITSAEQDQSTFDEFFTDATLRVDFHHTGDADSETVAFQRMIRQGVWAGPRVQLIDPFGHGRYAVKLIDPEDGRTVFSRAFDSYFGEYRTTDAARDGMAGVYHNTVLTPFPRRPLQLVIEARPAKGEPRDLAAVVVDPSSTDIATEPPMPGVIVVLANPGGAPHRTLDIAILGEGYRPDESALFRDDLARFTEVLLGHEPFKAHRASIAVRGVLLPSADSGVDEPTRGRYRSTSLGMTFNSLGSERYMLTEDNQALRDIAANVPYDALVIMVNEERYGGGGIYNSYCGFTAHGPWSEYLLLHEFGHSFGGLADEYYTSSVAYSEFYPQGREPAEPNITALLDPSKLKWRDLVEPETPLPTPWGKEEFDEYSEQSQARRKAIQDSIAEATREGAPAKEIADLERQAEELAQSSTQWAIDHLAGSQFSSKVGAFEGAGYASQGLYRPMADCLMFRRGVQPFCRVCERAVAEVILFHTGG